jgi:hypothetical protein
LHKVDGIRRLLALVSSNPADEIGLKALSTLQTCLGNNVDFSNRLAAVEGIEAIAGILYETPHSVLLYRESDVPEEERSSREAAEISVRRQMLLKSISCLSALCNANKKITTQILEYRRPFVERRGEDVSVVDVMLCGLVRKYAEKRALFALLSMARTQPRAFVNKALSAAARAELVQLVQSVDLRYAEDETLNVTNADVQPLNVHVREVVELVSIVAAVDADWGRMLPQNVKRVLQSVDVDLLESSSSSSSSSSS